MSASEKVYLSLCGGDAMTPTCAATGVEAGIARNRATGADDRVGTGRGAGTSLEALLIVDDWLGLHALKCRAGGDQRKSKQSVVGWLFHVRFSMVRA